MEHQVRLEQLESRSLAVVRRRARSAELSKVIPEACGTVWGVIRAQQVSGAGRNVALYWDCQDGQFKLEVGVEMDGPFAGHGDVVASATPAGLVAVATHYGPYGQLHGAHRAIHSWCNANGRTLAGPSWEVYGHWQDEWNRDPTKIRTDIFYLLDANGTQSTEPGAAADREE